MGTMKKRPTGFTLIELLVVIGIIAILSVAVYAALNPANRFAEARNARRYSDITSLLVAVHRCIADNSGSLTTCGITADSVPRAVYSGELDLSQELAPYLKSIPLDPQDDGNDGCYSLTANSYNIITIKAECAELDKSISVSR